MQVSNFKNSISGTISKSPEFLLFSMVLSFVLMFTIQMFYYATIFEKLVPNMAFSYAIGIGIGLMYQIARLSFGLAGAYEFSQGKTWTGVIGLLFSFGLTIFEAFEVEEMAVYWSASDSSIYRSIIIGLQAIIWLGLALEVRLALSLKGSPSGTNGANGKKYKASSNGVIAKVAT